MEKKIIMLATIALAFVIGLSLTYVEGQGLPSSLDDLEAQFNGTKVFLESLDARITVLENAKLKYNMEMQPFGTTDGAIKLVTNIIYFYGSELCKIDSGSAGSNLYIQFANTTTVKHETDCATTQTGTLISLSGDLDETFEKGDILVLEQDFANGFVWLEVHQGQS